MQFPEYSYSDYAQLTIARWAMFNYNLYEIGEIGSVAAVELVPGKCAFPFRDAIIHRLSYIVLQ